MISSICIWVLPGRRDEASVDAMVDAFSVWEYGDFLIRRTWELPYWDGSISIEPLNGLVALFFPWVPLIAFKLLGVGKYGAPVDGAWFGRLLSRSRVGGFVAGTCLKGLP